MPDAHSYEGVPIPALMWGARGSYGDASRRELAAAGCDDLPRTGGFVIAALDAEADNPQFRSQAEIVGSLRRSKQAASQLVDTLVLRGYIERQMDPEDRRRMNLRLTERGRAASAAIQRAVDAIDAELEARLTADELHGLRLGLATLAEIRQRERG
jgi:DNA-binding MarR family transcriptional regulator